MERSKFQHFKRSDKGDSEEDSDDNEFQKGDDESIDDDASEIGWNSEDETAFRRNVKKQDVSDYDSSSESDQEEPQEGEILLSDMLFDNKTTSATSRVNNFDTSDDDNSEGDNSADDEDDDDEDELDEVHNRLLSSIERFAKTAEPSKSHSGGKQSNQTAQESKYSSALDGAHVSMNALLGALDDSKDIATIKKRLLELERGLAAPSYVEKVTSDRMERHVAYDSTRGDMNKWQESVVANRHVAVLDLAQDKRKLASCKLLVTKHVPSTSLERDIQMVLVKHGTSDKAADQIESDELGARSLTTEEVRERQAELAKVKALMFYEQMKRHRMNKIKSKAYRSIHKRQRLRKSGKRGGGGDESGGDDGGDEEALDPEAAAEQKEKVAYDRVKERMDMRHKNTSKWARMALLHGHADKNLRAAYHESVQLGHELTQRMHEDVGARSGGDADDQDEDFEEAPGAGSGRKRKSVAQSAAEEMQNILSGGGSEGGTAVDGRYKKLFDMDFMRKAVDQQRQRAREDAESVLREIADMEHGAASDSDGEASGGVVASEDLGGKRKRSDSATQEARDEMKGLLGQKGQGSLMSISGAGKRRAVVAPFSEQSERVVLQSTLSSSASASSAAAPDAPEDNPWLANAAPAVSSQNAKSGGVRSKVNAPTGKQVLSTASVPSSSSGSSSMKPNGGGGSAAAAASSTITPAPAARASVPAAAAKTSKLPARVPLLMQKSQADLVRLAFAGPDLEEEFERFKSAEVDAELGLDEKRAAVQSSVKAGWGDWAGPGAAGVSQKILDKRSKLLTKIQTESEKKKLVRKDNKVLNVHINERRVKAASKYKIADIPHPFTSWEQYERSLQMPLGEDWNAANVVKSNTQPSIKLRAGRIIEPIKLAKTKATQSAK